MNSFTYPFPGSLVGEGEVIVEDEYSLGSDPWVGEELPFIRWEGEVGIGISIVESKCVALVSTIKTK